MGRGLSRVLLLVGMLGALLISLGLAASGTPGDEWRIQDHVILEDEVVTVEQNITVVEGGWLDLRGATLMFNNTEPGEHVLRVEDNGRLSTRVSTSGKLCEIRPVDAGSHTQIFANWASEIKLEDIRVTDCLIDIENTNNIVVRGTTLGGYFRIIDIWGCRNVVIEDCFFDDSWDTATAIYIFYSFNVTVKGNNVLGGGISVGVSTEVSILDNRIVSNFTGLSIRSSDGVLIKGNEFLVGGRSGCVVTNSKTVVWEQNVFYNSSSKFDVAKGLVISWSSFITVSRCRFENLSHGIDISNFENFSTPYNHITGNSIFNCTTGIHLASRNNTLEDNMITGSTTGIRINAKSSGTLIRRCRIEDSTVGIRVVSSMDTTLAGNHFSGNGCDLKTSSSRGTVERDGTHTSWESSAISLTGGDYRSVSCEFFSGGTVINASGAASASFEQSFIIQTGTVAFARDRSQVTLLNTTHPRRYDLDGTSTLEVYWDVEVSIHPESCPSHTLAGHIVVRDSDSEIVNETSIDVNDGAAKFVILEFELRGDSKDNRTPHELRAEAMDRYSTISENMTMYRRIIILIDDVPPELDVTSPEGEVHTSSKVLCSGSAVDNSDGHVSIGFYLDGVIFWQGFGGWDLLLNLQDGRHTVAVEATDPQNNTARWTMDLVVDTKPPSIVITSPPAPEYNTSDVLVVIEGTVTDAWNLTINGESVPCEQGDFQSTQDLPTDGAHTFEVRAQDEHGNEAVVILTITRDTEPPSIDLEDYPVVTRTSTVTINGTTGADCAVVLLDGNEVEFSPSGVFMLDLVLSEGPNSFELHAVDELGNENRTSISITLDSVAHIEILAPVNGTVFEVQDIEILVLVEPGARARVKDGGWHASDPHGYARINVSLHLDETMLVLETEDAAGNEGRTSIVVYFSPPKQAEGGNTILVIGFIMGLVIIGSAALLFFRSRELEGVDEPGLRNGPNDEDSDPQVRDPE